MCSKELHGAGQACCMCLVNKEFLMALLKHGLAAASLLILCLLTHPAHAREQIRIVGSSTLYPFSSMAAEQFGQDKKFRTPIVESTGTGGGFKLFCNGVGDATPDIANASRLITDSERKRCAKNGVHRVVEMAVGYDGIVIANAKDVPPLTLTKKHLFTALAGTLPGKDGKLHANPYHYWNEIDPKLPASKIEVYGPPPTSGTRDAFVELVMEAGCKSFPAFITAYPDEKERKKRCGLMREDGGYIDAGEDDNIIVQKLASNKNALGIFGYSFLEENLSSVHAATIEGVAPTLATIENASYTVARSLYIYIKADHIPHVPGLAEFAREIVSESAIGENGYLINRGLLPLQEKDKKASQEKAIALTRIH